MDPACGVEGSKSIGFIYFYKSLFVPSGFLTRECRLGRCSYPLLTQLQLPPG